MQGTDVICKLSGVMFSFYTQNSRRKLLNWGVGRGGGEEQQGSVVLQRPKPRLEPDHLGPRPGPALYLLWNLEKIVLPQLPHWGGDHGSHSQVPESELDM